MSDAAHEKWGILARDELIESCEELATTIATLRKALLGLANAADDVGVKFFDTDTVDPVVALMQAATAEARAALGNSTEGK